MKTRQSILWSIVAFDALYLASFGLAFIVPQLTIVRAVVMPPASLMDFLPSLPHDDPMMRLVYVCLVGMTCYAAVGTVVGWLVSAVIGSWVEARPKDF